MDAQIFKRNPVVAALMDKNWSTAMASSAEIIFLFKASIMTLNDRVAEAHSKNKKLLVHADLIDGISKDKAGLEYLKTLGVDGIISTRNQLIHFAKEIGLFTVQRLFIIDSMSVKTIQDSVDFAKPDIIELMPAFVSKVIKNFTAGDIPVIAGGLISTKEEVLQVLEYGVISVSTSESTLWDIKL